MSFHIGQLHYALCDHWDGNRRCEAQYVPTRLADVFAPSHIFAPRGEVFAAIRDAGWQVTRLNEHDDEVLCPQHRTSPAPAPRATEVVDVPLFDLPDGASR